MKAPKPFPQAHQPEVEKLLAAAVAKNRCKIVVLDDDPTGVQTVHHVSVYTDWSLESLRSGFLEDRKLFFILTNSRAMTAEQTAAAHREIVRNVMQVANETKQEFLLISRGDSTLRGHYPLETECLREGLEAHDGHPVDGEILCPYFREGGRLTVGNVHYVQSGDELIPAAEMEFAKDKTFGYAHSDLREYVQEKTNGAYRAEDVQSVTLEELRALEFDRITAKLELLHDFGKLIVNAADETDLKVFCVALYQALEAGKRFLFRTAASFVKAIADIPDQPLLGYAEMMKTKSGSDGIIVVGSHTKKTTEQLETLLTLPQAEGVALNSDLVLVPGALETETERVIRACDTLIRTGITPVVYTKRTVLVLPEDTPEAALVRSVRISEALQSVVAGLSAAPAFIIAKGGITSSDIAVKALRVKHAEVLGQIRPGVPVWQTGAESRFPAIPYVIFPGNVGQADTLREAAEILLHNKA